MPTAINPPSLRMEIIEADPAPVIDVGCPGTEDNRYGFEGGRFLRGPDGAYHLFTAERNGDPLIVRMRLAHWTSPDARTWTRVSTLFESSGDFTGTDPRAALWGPMPVYGEERGRWALFYVAYRAKPNTPEAWYENHEGRIWLAWSEVAGPAGLPGPYRDAGVILEPDANSQPWEGLQGVDSFFPFQAGSRWLGFYGSAQTQVVPCPFWGTGLAEAPALAGPWTRMATGNPVKMDPVFAENPVVSRHGDTWLALVDGGPNGSFGYATSANGLTWSQAEFLPLSPPLQPWWSVMRTPLGIVEDSDGSFTLLYTAWKERAGDTPFGAVGRIRVRLANTASDRPASSQAT
jgi:hypothetical protein